MEAAASTSVLLGKRGSCRLQDCEVEGTILAELREQARANHLPTRGLARDEDERLLPELGQYRHPALKGTFYEANHPIRHVHFPVSGMISTIANLKDAGMVGLPVFLEAETTPMTTFAQVSGAWALRLRHSAMKVPR